LFQLLGLLSFSYALFRELTKAVEPYIKQEDEGKFRCKTCQKLFKATSFVEKHIANKHPELVKQLDEVSHIFWGVRSWILCNLDRFLTSIILLWILIAFNLWSIHLRLSEVAVKLLHLKHMVSKDLLRTLQVEIMDEVDLIMVGMRHIHLAASHLRITTDIGITISQDLVILRLLDTSLQGHYDVMMADRTGGSVIVLVGLRPRFL
jgi:Arsenite-resistance protein 2